MAVNEIITKLGSFGLKLKGTTPRDVIDGIQYFGHIAIIPGENVSVAQYGDNLLDSARYVGVVRGKTWGGDDEDFGELTLDGVGMAFWLGDEDDKGAVYETTQTFAAIGFATTINTLLPDSVSAGNLSAAVTGTFTGEFQYQTPRFAIDYVCDTMSTTAIPVSWRMNGNGSLDAGPESVLFVTTPTCVLVRKGIGEDLTMRALKGHMETQQDVEDFTTRVVLLAEQEDGGTLATGNADIAVNPYKDIHGNALAMTRLVSESETTTANATVRAQLQLNRFTDTRDALTLSTDDYDVNGTFKVGDYVWVYDPDAGLYDNANEIIFRGRRINPMKLQVHETGWDVIEGYTVGYRDNDGNWIDLTQHIEFETSETVNIVVGAFRRSLTSSDESVGIRLGSITLPDTTSPGQTTFVTASFETVTYLDSNGNAKARQKLVWNQPLNTDLTAVTDGDYYEIQYRLDTSEFNTYSQTWTAASTLTWDGAETWDTPVDPDATPFQSMFVAFGSNEAVINELLTGVAYDFQIRLIDTSANQGAFSGQESVTMSTDNIPPSTPAAPTVAGSTLNIQVVHTLGKASGGTYNLENDLGHLEVHYSFDQNFTPTTTSLVGMLRANASTIAAQVPAIGSFPVLTTTSIWVKVIAVDLSGNKSSPSDPSSVTAELIDSENVSELTASKISAGTISADWILGARIKTADSGARAELNSSGFQAYNAVGDQTFDVDSATGDVSITGTFKSGPAGQRVELSPSNSSTSRAELRLYSENGNDYGTIAAYQRSSDWYPGYTGPQQPVLSVNSGLGIDESLNIAYSELNLAPDLIKLGIYLDDGVSGTHFFAKGGFSAGFESATGSTYLNFDDSGILTTNCTFDALVETTTSGATAATNFTINSFTARKTCGIATLKVVLDVTGGTVTSGATGNITDTLAATLPSGWRPQFDYKTSFDADSTADGSCRISTDGTITLQSLSPGAVISTTDRNQVTISATFVL